MMNGTGSVAQQMRVLDQIAGIEMQVDVPAQRADARDDAVELAHVGHAAQMLHEVEAHAAKAAGMQRLEVPLA